MYFQDIRVNDSFFIITKEAQTQTTWPQKAQTQTKDIDTQIPRRSQREASLRCSILIKKYTEILTKDSDYDNDSDSSDHDHNYEKAVLPKKTVLPAQKRKRGRPCKNPRKIQAILHDDHDCAYEEAVFA